MKLLGMLKSLFCGDSKQASKIYNYMNKANSKGIPDYAYYAVGHKARVKRIKKKSKRR